MEQKKHVLVRFDPKLVEQLDLWAKKMEIPREQLIKNLCRAGIDDLKIAEQFGLISVIMFIKKKMEKGKDITEIIPSLS